MPHQYFQVSINDYVPLGFLLRTRVRDKTSFKKVNDDRRQT